MSKSLLSFPTCCLRSWNNPTGQPSPAPTQQATATSGWIKGTAMGGNPWSKFDPMKKTITLARLKGKAGVAAN
jgi:hypothetical protein